MNAEKKTFVGPILQNGHAADAVIAAIKEMNSEVFIENKGAYTRIFCPQHCSVSPIAIAEHLGYPFNIPTDLEEIMLSFQGFLHFSENAIVWKSLDEKK